MGMSWKPRRIKGHFDPCAHREQDSPFQQQGLCRGSWLAGAVLKDLSWAVRQLPQNAEVHSEPEFSRNQILILEEVTITCICSLHIFISEGSSPWNLLSHGKFSPQQKRSSFEIVSTESHVSVTKGW